MEKDKLSREIKDILSRIWETTLDMELRPVTQAEDFGILTSIRISGAWNGSIILECNDRLASEIASRVFSDTRKEDLSQAQREDCLREITNMLAGNLKTILPEPCELGLAQVSRASVNSSSDLFLRECFQTADSSLAVSIQKSSGLV